MEPKLKAKIMSSSKFWMFFNTLWVIYQVHKTHQKKPEYVFNCHASEVSIVYLLKWPVVSLQWADFQKKLNFLKDGTKIKTLYSDAFVTSEPPKYSWLVYFFNKIFVLIFLMILWNALIFWGALLRVL